jgi:hypothetical protein
MKSGTSEAFPYENEIIAGESRVTPGEEAGKEVRDAAGAMNGATAPQPVGVANGGSKASVPVMQPTPEENARMTAIKARLEGRLREMRDARMQADKDVVAKAGIMPGQVPASNAVENIKDMPNIRTLPATSSTTGTITNLPATDETRANAKLQNLSSVRTPMSPAATARAEKTVVKAGMTEQERIDEARRRRIAAAAAARKREQDAYMREFMAAERASAGEVPPPTMAPYTP